MTASRQAPTSSLPSLSTWITWPSFSSPQIIPLPKLAPGTTCCTSDEAVLQVCSGAAAPFVFLVMLIQCKCPHDSHSCVDIFPRFKALQELRSELTDLHAVHDSLTSQVRAGQEKQSATAKGQAQLDNKMATLSTDLSQKIEELARRVAALEVSVRTPGPAFLHPATALLSLLARQPTFQLPFPCISPTFFPPSIPVPVLFFPDVVDKRAWLGSKGRHWPCRRG